MRYYVRLLVECSRAHDHRHLPAAPAGWGLLVRIGCGVIGVRIGSIGVRIGVEPGPKAPEATAPGRRPPAGRGLSYRRGLAAAGRGSSCCMGLAWESPRNGSGGQGSSLGEGREDVGTRRIATKTCSVSYVAQDLSPVRLPIPEGSRQEQLDEPHAGGVSSREPPSRWPELPLKTGVPPCQMWTLMEGTCHLFCSESTAERR